LDDTLRAEFERRLMTGDVREELEELMREYIETLIAAPQKVATRKASEMALTVINEAIPEMIGGSADLTGSNLTKTENQAPLTASNYGGRYLYYGIREFGMAAAMNGMALHGGVIPYGGTFLVFTDYCRPAMRLSAIQKQRVIYVMTHDSIGQGEDGPTHQPIEHLASLRAMPNMTLFRPCDAVETAECWALALRNSHGPTVLALSRQNVPQVRLTSKRENMCAKGAYVLSGADDPKVVLLGTGSEVQIAVEVQKLLAVQGVAATVVSMPSWEIFEKQSPAYKASVLPSGTLKVVIEAAASQGWHKYIGRAGLFFGLDTFGASAPAEKLYEHFGLTAKNVAEAITKAL
jgi:transketolase